MSKHLTHSVMWMMLCALVVVTNPVCAQTSESQDDEVVSIEAFATEEVTDTDATTDSDEESESQEYVDEGEPISVEDLGVEGDQPEAETSPPADLPAWARFEPMTPRLVGSGDGASNTQSDVQDPLPATSPQEGSLPEDRGTEGNRSRLLNDSDSREVPVTGDDEEGAARRIPLPKDGSFIQDRQCRLYRHPESNWLILRFVPDEEGRAPADCWVLPSRLLEEMEKTASVQPDAVFRVSGESKVYRKRAFIHLGKVGVESDFDPLEGAVREEDVEIASEDDADAEDRTIEEGSSDDVLDVLLTERPAMPVVKPRESNPEDREQPGGVSPAIEDQDVTHPGRGQSVVDRTVIFLPSEEGQWTEVVFESDNHGQEPPLRALPCAALSKAERTNNDRPHDSVRFRVSGEITEYKGKRYLLIRKAIERRDMDEF